MDNELPTSSRGNWLAACLMLAGGAAATFAALCVVLSLPGIPYNVRAMFPPTHRTLAMAAFSVTVVWAGFAPGAAARVVLDRPAAVWLCPLAAAIVALLSWFYLRFSLTDKVLRDVVGSATLGFGREWEWIARFLALGGGVMLLLIVGGLSVGAVAERGWRSGWRLGARALAISLPFLVVARIVVIDCASTDNLTELLRTRPWPGDVFVMLLVLVLGANAAALAHARGKWLALAAAATVALVPAGWWLLELALEPAVEKYGVVFPAARFLLGPDRQTAIPTVELFARWAAVQLGAVAVLSCGWRAARKALAVGPAPASAADVPLSRRPGLAYGIFTLAYALLLIGASLTPFRFYARPFGEVWGTFWDLGFLTRVDSGPSDIAINLIAYVPLTFAAMAALTRQGTRRRAGLLAAAVLTGGVLLSVLMEFLQMYVPASTWAPGQPWSGGRVSSLFDILSQAAGGVVGLTLWFAWGRSFTRQARSALGGPVGGSLMGKVLAVYAIGLVLHQIAPFDFTLSARNLGQRIKPFWMGYPPAQGGGRVVTIPFTDPLEMPGMMDGRAWAGEWAFKAVLLVPVGLLLAIVLRRRRHPVRAAFLGAAALAAGIEVAQLFLRSRFSSATDVVLGAAGGLVGAILGARLAREKAFVVTP